MLVSQRCQYALRAVFELCKRSGHGPVKNADIAEAQAIPPRFLEVILSQLKRAGFIDSKRGSAGGYVIAKDPAELTVGDVMRFMGGPVGPVECVGDASARNCALYGNCVFLSMWERARRAVCEVYDTTTFADLIEEEKLSGKLFVPSYSI